MGKGGSFWMEEAQEAQASTGRVQKPREAQPGWSAESKGREVTHTVCV